MCLSTANFKYGKFTGYKRFVPAGGQDVFVSESITSNTDIYLSEVDNRPAIKYIGRHVFIQAMDADSCSYAGYYPAGIHAYKDEIRHTGLCMIMELESIEHTEVYCDNTQYCSKIWRIKSVKVCDKGREIWSPKYLGLIKVPKLLTTGVLPTFDYWIIGDNEGEIKEKIKQIVPENYPYTSQIIKLK